MLVVEDDLVMRKVLRVALSSHGYEVVEAATGAQALAQMRSRCPDAMLLDLGLPDMDGVEVARLARAEYEFPIIVLSARNEEQQLVLALDSGASDYMTKPFREGELMARLRAALRPISDKLSRRELRVGDLRMLLIERCVFVAERDVPLTTKEFELLLVLAREAGRVVKHERLLSEVWGPTAVRDTQYLRVFIRQIRSKLEDEPSRPRRIVTALGIGYRLVPCDADVATS